MLQSWWSPISCCRRTQRPDACQEQTVRRKCRNRSATASTSLTRKTRYGRKYAPAFSCDQDFKDFWPEYQNLDELKEHYTRGGLGDMKCKKFLNEVLNKFLDPMRQRRAELEQDIPEICNILKKGTEQAREVGAQTMDEVRRAMRIDYFNDAEMWRI